jgi:hypothetical protein
LVFADNLNGMSQKIELYALLMSYSRKTFTPTVVVDKFMKFLEKTVEVASDSRIDYWKTDTRNKVMRDLIGLSDDGKISLAGTGDSQKLIIHNFYSDLIEKEYLYVENGGGKPFPNEVSLKIKIPNDKVKAVGIESEFLSFLTEEKTDPCRIIKLIFPGAFSEAIALEKHCPTKILEAALVKLRPAMTKKTDLEYYLQKLQIRFANQESRTREFINLILNRPLDALKTVEESNDFIYSVINYFCGLVKKQMEDNIEKEGDVSAENVSIAQGAVILTVINDYYQSYAMKKKEKELSFAKAESKIADAPYLFTFEEIKNFTNPSGFPLLERYSNQDLAAFLKERTDIKSNNNNILPPILKFKLREGGEIYVAKEKAWFLASKLLVEARNSVKSDVQNRWREMLRKYKREKAMDKESDFETLLAHSCNLYSPMLLIIVQDKKTCLLQSEIILEKGSISGSERLFDGEKPLPLHVLLALHREDILRRAKLSLPFWYSIPPFVSIMSFIKGTKKEEKEKEKKAESDKENKNKKEGLTDSVEGLLTELVPKGNDVDKYLNELSDIGTALW